MCSLKSGVATTNGVRRLRGETLAVHILMCARVKARARVWFFCVCLCLCLCLCLSVSCVRAHLRVCAAVYACVTVSFPVSMSASSSTQPSLATQPCAAVAAFLFANCLLRRLRRMPTPRR